jgi:hypothetical protein
MIAPRANHSKFYPNTHLVSTSKIKTLRFTLHSFQEPSQPVYHTPHRAQSPQSLGSSSPCRLVGPFNVCQLECLTTPNPSWTSVTESLQPRWKYIYRSPDSRLLPTYASGLPLGLLRDRHHTSCAGLSVSIFNPVEKKQCSVVARGTLSACWYIY